MVQSERNVPIRSWSGGRVYEDIVKCSSFFNNDSGSSSDFESVKIEQVVEDNHVGQNSIDNNSTSSPELGSSELYDDEFYSTDANNSIDSSSSTSRADSFVQNISSDVNLSDSNDSSVGHIHSQSNLEIEHECKDRLDANSKHKSWLAKLQNAMNSSKRETEEKVMRKLQRDTARRIRIIEQARSKGKVGYDAITVAAQHGKMIQATKQQDDSDDAPLDQEERARQKETRRRHKKMYKQYLDELVQKREMELLEVQYAEEQVNETKKRVTQIVLSKMKNRKKPIVDDFIDAKEDMPKGGRILKPMPCVENATERNNVISIIQAKYLEQMAEVQRVRKQKEMEAEKLKRRLDKRASILRRKYDTKLPALKPWGPCGGESDESKEPEQPPARNTSDPDGHEVAEDTSEEGERCILSPSRVDALTKRLTKTSKHDSMVNCTDFDQWRRQNGVLAHQHVFSMTGWYPSVSLMRDSFSTLLRFNNILHRTSRFEMNCSTGVGSSTKTGIQTSLI